MNAPDTLRSQVPRSPRRPTGRALLVAVCTLALVAPVARAQGRPPDLSMTFVGEVRLRFQRGISGANHAITMKVDRAANGPGWDESYDLGLLAGASPVIDTGIRVVPADQIDVVASVMSGQRVSLVVTYSSDRDTRPGEPGPRVIDHHVQGDRHLCGGGPEGPADVTNLFVTADHLISLTCWEDASDFDWNDFALAVDYTPDSVPTETATSTATATPSVTATSTPTATSSPTLTATAPPRPAYLPLALRELCAPDRRGVDVALVVDASTSMLDLAPSGATKMSLAREAVASFVDSLDVDRDRAALVAFNSDAVTVRTLTGDRASLAAGLAEIANARGTRLDLGVVRGRQALEAGPDLGHDRVMIVLTDGRAEPVSPEVAVAEAATAKALGIRLITIGVGFDVDRAALLAMATAPTDYLEAPSADDLHRVYRTLATTLPCPGRFWGGR